MVPPKVSISDYLGILKGRTAIRVFNKFSYLKKSPIGEIIFGSEDIVLSQLVLMRKIFIKYVKYQEAQERKQTLKSNSYGYF